MPFSKLVSDISLNDSLKYVLTAWDAVRPVIIRHEFERTLAIGGDRGSSSKDHTLNKSY